MQSEMLAHRFPIPSFFVGMILALTGCGSSGSAEGSADSGSGSAGDVAGRSSSSGGVTGGRSPGGGLSSGGSAGGGAATTGGSDSSGSGGSGTNASGGVHSGGQRSGGTQPGGNDPGGGGSSGGNHSDGPSSGGPSSGGSAGSGADTVGGTGALAGLSAGGDASSGDGGAGGAGGEIVPPSPEIPCGEATCDADSQACCIDVSGRSCSRSDCSAVIRLGCDDAVDCSGGVCCFANFSASARVSTRCSTTECENTGAIQVCTEAGECDNGDPCHVYTCPSNFDLSITLGLCTATAPMPCE